MATYSEQIMLPYSHENWELAAKRVGEWLRSSGTILRVEEKGPQSVRLRGNIGVFPFSSPLTFILKFSEQGVDFEGWIGAAPKMSIKPSGFVGKFPRDVAWAEYQSLVRALKQESDASSLGIELQ